MGFPPTPASIKSISHFLKVADEHDSRNIVISYWCRMFAIQHAMKILPGPKPADVSSLLLALMDWLEVTKQQEKDNEGIANETGAQALIEEYAMKLFNYAETQDRAEQFEKNMVKAFYTSGILFDILEQFGQLSEDIEEKRKYAKYRAAYIHNCLKNGQPPTAGSTTVLYTDKDEEEYKEFLSKEDLDRSKGRIPANDSNANSMDNPVSPPPAINSVPPVTPATPSTPGNPSGNSWPNYTPTVPAQLPNQPFTANVLPPQPLPRAVPSTPASPPALTSALTPDQMERAQKYCKWATSALNYDDVKTAVDNLQKALHLLQFGKEL